MPAAAALAAARPAQRRTSEPALRVVKAQARRPKASSADEATTRYAPCRVLGHEWHHVGRADASDASAGAHGSIGWVSTCSHCGMRRVRWFTRSGMVASSPTYSPPEGYSRHGDDRLSMQEWRSTWIGALGLDR